uniref:Uncharacterized protein n=1 Tax=Lygus hesperus TaxID=30085 RepID=A0A0K8T2S3_LYGHE
MAVFLAACNSFSSSEFFWTFFRRFFLLAISYMIYSENKIHQLEKRIYELTWTHSKTLTTNMFKVAPQRSKTSLRRSSSSIIKQKEYDTWKSQHKSTVSISSDTERPRRRSVLQMGGVSNDNRIYKIKSSPVLEDSESWNVEYGGKKILISSFQPMNPMKRLKTDLDDNRSTTTSQDSNSMVMRIFQKPQDSKHHTIIVEYCNVQRTKGATKYPSGISQNQSSCTTITKHHFTESNGSTISWGQKRFQNEDVDRKWRRIIERNQNIRNDRLAKLKEMELQKLQERERARKAEMARRRAIIARIREQNRKLLKEQRGMIIDQNDGCNNEIVLPVVRRNVKPMIDSIDYQQPLFKGPEPWVGEVPVLRVTQRTVTVEHTAQIRQFDHKKEYNMMESKTLQMSDMEANDGEFLQNMEKETPGPKIARSSEYYLLSRGTPPNKQFVYLKMSSNTGVTPNGTSFAKVSDDEIHHRHISTYGDMKQAGLNSQAIQRESNSLFQCSSTLLNYEEDSKTFPPVDVPCPVASIDPTKAAIDQAKIDELGSTDAHRSTEILKSGLEETNVIQDEPDEKTLENVKVPYGDGGNPLLPATPSGDYDVEAPPITPSPPTKFDSEGPRPAMRRAKRRLLKDFENAVPSENNAVLSGNKAVQLESIVSNPVHFDTLEINDSAKQKENRAKPKPQNVKVGFPKSLLLKKIEVRKKLEERRKAEICRDLYAIGQEKKGSDIRCIEERLSDTTKTSIRPSVPANKPRRCSFDGNTGRVKQVQSRAQTVTMKKGNLRSPEEKLPKASTPRAAVTRPYVTSPNKRAPFRTGVQTPTDGTQCRIGVYTSSDGARCRSPVSRRFYHENYVPKSDLFTKVPDRPKTASPEKEDSFCQSNDDKRSSSGTRGGNGEDTVESVTEGKILAESHTEVKEQCSSTADSNTSTSKRPDFLAFEMDAFGHPVPVKHSKATRLSIIRGVNRRKSEENVKMQKNYTRKPNKQEDTLRKSTKPFLKDEFLNKVDEKEWNRRMKTWEKKREQLELGLVFSQGVRNEQKQQPRVSYGTPTNQSKNERVETNNTTSPRGSAIEDVNNHQTTTYKMISKTDTLSIPMEKKTEK